MNDDFDSIFEPDNSTSTEVTDEIVEQPSTETETEAEVITEPEVAIEQEVPAEVAVEMGEDDVEESGGHQVPLATFLNMTGKKKAAVAENAALRKRIEELEQASKAPPVQIDPYEDPHGFVDHRIAQVEQQMFAQKLELCGQFAVQAHGQEAVSNAANWAQSQMTDPAFARSFQAAPNPVEFIIKQHSDAVRIHEMQTDPVAYARRIAAEQGWFTASTPAPEVSAQPTQQKGKRSPSLTDIPAAGGKATVRSTTEAFNSHFD